VKNDRAEAFQMGSLDALGEFSIALSDDLERNFDLLGKCRLSAVLS
jgi:hypothetical protein